LPVPFPQKPLAEIKLTHRQRTRRRRALKRLVAEQAANTLLPALVSQPSPAPPAVGQHPIPAPASNSDSFVSHHS
jgi:hypothetical protein